MREILFRGKPMFRENNNFVYGYYKCGNISDVKTDFILPLPEYKNEINEVAVCSQTVGQFTGLTDKNGVKIFEGDIVKTEDTIGYVSFNDSEFKLNWDSFDPRRQTRFKKCGLKDFGSFKSLEIIGNVHDNPELLKGDNTEC